MTMATLEQLQARLAAAEEAYDALMVGQSARIVVDSNGERVASGVYFYMLKAGDQAKKGKLVIIQ